MANYGSKVRRAKAAHKKSQQKTSNEARLQQMYINTFSTFDNYAKGIGRPETTSRVTPGTPRGGWTRQDRLNKVYEKEKYQPFDAFTFFRPEDIIKSQGGSTSLVSPVNFRLDKFITHRAKTQKQSIDTYRSIADSYKGKALSAEFGLLNAAQKSATQASKPLDLSYIRSARGGTGNSPSKNAAGFYISSGGITGVTTSNTPKDYSNQSYKDQKTYGKARQDAETKEGKAAIDAKWQSDIQSSYFSQFGLEAASKLSNAQKPLVKNAQHDWSSSTMSYLGILPDGKRTSAATQQLTARQQELIDQNPGSGLVTFGLDGRVSAAPMSGNIDWSQFDNMTPEKIKQVKGDISDIMVKRDIMSQLSEQQSEEKAIDKKITASKNKLEQELSGSNFFGTQRDDKGHVIISQNKESSLKDKIAADAFKLYGNFANPDYIEAKEYGEARGRAKETDLLTGVDYSGGLEAVDAKRNKDLGTTPSGVSWSEFEGQQKIIELEKDLNLLNLEKQSIHKKRTMLGNAVSSVGRNKLYQKLYESGTYNPETMNMFLTINTDEDRDRSINDMQTMAQEQGMIQTSITTLSKLERKLKHLKNIKNKVSISNWNKQRDKVYDEIKNTITNTKFNDESSIKDVKAEVVEISKDYSKVFKDINIKKNKLALKIAKNSTMTQRVEDANILNKTTNTKRDIEKMTGWDVSGKSPDYIMSEWDKTWIGGGAKKLMRSDESINLLTGGKQDISKLKELKAGSAIINQYDAWSSAGSYIGGEISEYKTDIKKTYKRSHFAAPVPDSVIAKSWFGKSTVDGYSFTLSVADQIGVRDGLYARQDVQKIVSESEKIRTEMKDELDIKKQEIVSLREKQSSLQSSHDELLPLIDQQVEKDYSAVHGKTSGDGFVSTKFAKKLSTSSEKLYDINYKVAENQVSQKFYEKSLVKTEKDIEQYKKYKKILDFEAVKQGTSSSGMINRIRRSGSWGRNQANRFRRNTGSRRKTTRGGRQSLGGLVR